MNEPAPSRVRLFRLTQILGWVLLGVMAIGGGLLGEVCGGEFDPDAAHRIRLWQACYAVGFIGFVALLWSFSRRPPRPAIIILGAIALRIPLLFAPPNTDCNRYIWEGRVQNLGFSPYLVAPDADELKPHRDVIYDCINHKEYTTIYPPLSLLFFRLLAAIDYSIKSPQIAHGLLDMLIVIALVGLVKTLNRPIWQAGIYAFCPMVLASFAHAGHNDSLMILPLIGFIAAALKQRWKLAGFLLGLAVLAKTTSVILFALLLRRSWRAIAVGLLTILAGYALFWDSGRGLLHTLIRFPSESPFNNPFDALRVWIRQVGGPAMYLSQRNILAAVVLSAIALYHAWRPADLVRDARRLLAITVLFLPIIHFWYLTWPLALIALCPRGYWSWLVLAGTMALYWHADWAATVGQPWKLPLWAVMAIWIPFWVAWGMERRLRPGPPSQSAR